MRIDPKGIKDIPYKWGEMAHNATANDVTHLDSTIIGCAEALML